MRGGLDRPDQVENGCAQRICCVRRELVGPMAGHADAKAKARRRPAALRRRTAARGTAGAAGFPAEAAASAQPITLGPALLVFLDRMKRERFLADWDAAVRQP